MGRLWLAGACMFFLCCIGGVAYGEDAGMPAMSVPAALISEPNIEWLWGEVISVDEAAKTVKVKYLDYESDEEKDMSIAVNGQTTYESVAVLGQIKAGDTVSVDYVFEASGSILAKNISVEKSEHVEKETSETLASSPVEAKAPAVQAEVPVVPEVTVAVAAADVAPMPEMAAPVESANTDSAQSAAEAPATAK